MKKITVMLACIILCLCMTGCGTEKDLSDHTQKQFEQELGAFEITAAQRELAADNEKGLKVLDAGRGNPNWINTQSRYAFARFMEFALQECERTFSDGNMAGQAEAEGLEERFYQTMNTSDKTDRFLVNAVDYCSKELGLDKNSLLEEFVNGIIGDYYPSPAMCLENSEVILNEYLQDTMYDGNILAGETQVFPTEGGTAAICYIFNALHHNRILNEGDKIAIAEPIFTPYLQIPDVNNYGLVSIDITSNEDENWDLPDEAFEVLSDPEIKAFFLVNPSNPASHQLTKKSLKKIAEAVENNPDLIIITDDVYGTFVNHFETVYSVVPHNTILVYSFSKIYGVTGWRLGLIAMNRENIVDDLIGDLSEDKKEFLRKEYSIVTEDPDSMTFIERIVADSRSIGLYHTSGLSTPQQIFMDFLALTHLICEEDDPYFRQSNEIIEQRYAALMETLDLPFEKDRGDAMYYALINLYKVAGIHYGQAFADWLSENVNEIDFLNDFAGRYGVVLMYGPGFGAEKGSVRVSLANLNEADYVDIGKRLLMLLDEYYSEFEIKEAA